MNGMRVEMRGGQFMVTDYTPGLPMAGGPIYLSFMRAGQEYRSSVVKLTFQDKYLQPQPAPRSDPGFQKERQELNSFKQNMSTTSIVTSVERVHEPTGNVKESNGTLNKDSSSSTQNIHDEDTMNSDFIIVNQVGSYLARLENDITQKVKGLRGLKETNASTSQIKSMANNVTSKGRPLNLNKDQKINENIQKKWAKRRQVKQFQKDAACVGIGQRKHFEGRRVNGDKMPNLTQQQNNHIEIDLRSNETNEKLTLLDDEDSSWL